MQVKKDNIKGTILDVSRKSFLERGYKQTTMRGIAKEANVTLSNIYNYFKNKDEILEVILRPLFAEMDHMFDRHNDPYYATTSWFDANDITEIEEFKEHVEFIISYREDIKLLLYKCSGSKYENIKEEIIDKYTLSSKSYLNLMKDKYPQVNENISDFFLHTTAAWWIQIMSEIVSHNLDEKEIWTFMHEYMTFATGGWKRLMNL